MKHIICRVRRKKGAREGSTRIEEGEIIDEGRLWITSVRRGRNSGGGYGYLARAGWKGRVSEGSKGGRTRTCG